MRLAFEHGERGTFLARQASAAPMRCVRPFALDSGERVLQLLHVGPGLMGGDRLELDVEVFPGAQAILVAQAATKVHAMDDGSRAELRVRLRVAAGASLEFHPGLTIPYAGSALRQRVEVDLEAGARFALVERWSAGRIARGERHAYRHVSSRVHVRSGGAPIYADALELEAGMGDAVGVFEGHDYLAGALFVGGQPPPLGRANAPTSPPLTTVAFGPEQYVVRALAHDGVALGRALGEAVSAWRRTHGRPPIPFERFGSG
jgi:urease accessory protein